MEKIYQSSAEKDANSNIWLDIEQKSAKSPVQAAAPDDIWQLTEGRLNHAKYKPVKIPDAEVADVSTKAGEARYALRNPHNDKYIIIGDEELFLWNLIDGQNTVKDIALEYITRYDALGSELLMDLLDALRNDGFLEEQPVSVFQSLKEHFHKDTLSAAAMSVVVFFCSWNPDHQKSGQLFYLAL